MTPTSERWLLNGLTGIVVVSVAAATAPLTWRLTGEAAGAADGVAAPRYRPLAPAPDVSGLAAFTPFGQPGLATVSAAGLGLTLKGVMMAVPRSQSTAIIAPASGASAAYFPGEALPGGAVVDRIAVDYVVLRTPGGLANLYFPGDERAQVAVPAAAPGVISGGIAPTPAAASGGPDVATFIGGLLTSGNPTVSAVPPQLAAQGLQAGDQVRSVNGVDVANLAGDRRLIDEAMRSGSVRLMVSRGGTLVPLVVSVR